MLRSALRTMSVITVLSAVAAGVVLLHRPGLTSSETTLAKDTLADAVLADAVLPGSSGSSGSSVSSSGSVPASAAAEPVDRLPATEKQLLAPTGSMTTLSATRLEAKVLDQRREYERRERAEEARRQALERAARDATRNPQAAARLLLAKRGWSGQFSCLESLWNKESRWNYRAANPSSGAYGIPQSLPGSKMASAGADWRTNPMTQIKWGLGYIDERYGSPCAAWSHSQSTGWY